MKNKKHAASPQGQVLIKHKFSQFFGIFLVLFVLIFFLTTINNFGPTFNPADYINEAKSLLKSKNDLSVSTPAEPEQIKNLVPSDLYPAFYLIQSDKQFSYLADLLIKYKIKITIAKHDCNGGQACYENIHGLCNIANPGEIFVLPDIMGAYHENLAGILVHELTHAKNKLENPNYYCRDNFYLSNEFLAYKNETMFKHQYEKITIFDYYDLNDNFHDYPLYKNTKRLYPNLVDDMNMQPTNNIFETIFSSFYDHL